MPSFDQKKWDTKYHQGSGLPGPPSPLLTELSALLPQSGRALDLAGGAGRNALWLAGLGLDVCLVDISGVALRIARNAASAGGLCLQTQQLDLQHELLPDERWDLIVVVRYLNRELFGRVQEMLQPGGLFVLLHPTRSNLLKNPRPSPSFLLEDGEAPQLVTGLEILQYEEGWFDAQHLCRMVARLA